MCNYVRPLRHSTRSAFGVLLLVCRSSEREPLQHFRFGCMNAARSSHSLILHSLPNYGAVLDWAVWCR